MGRRREKLTKGLLFLQDNAHAHKSYVQTIYLFFKIFLFLLDILVQQVYKASRPSLKKSLSCSADQHSTVSIISLLKKILRPSKLFFVRGKMGWWSTFGKHGSPNLDPFNCYIFPQTKKSLEGRKTFVPVCICPQTCPGSAVLSIVSLKSKN